MKISILMCTLITAISLSAHAGTSAQEKAFIDKYKTAFEAKDTAVLESFLYAQGADPAILGFYKMMQSSEAGGKISKIDLVDLTPEDVKKATTPQDSPTGGKVCLILRPTKSSLSRSRKKAPTAAQAVAPKISSPRKTANSLSPFQGRVNKGPSVRGAILVKHRTRFVTGGEAAS